MAIHPETRTQIDTLKWLKLYNKQAFDHVIKIDNEGIRTKVGKILAIQSGLHIGASDIFLAYPVKLFHGCFLEIKPDGWTLTPSKQKHYESQMEFIYKMRRAGYAADMKIGLNECIDYIMVYLKS